MRLTLARPLVAALLLLAQPAAPAAAAGVGFSLPKFRALSVGSGAASSNSFGGSVSVVGTSFSAGPVKVDLDLDYAYTRNFSSGGNYSFFDIGVGAGVPLGFTKQFYLQPMLDTHTLFFVASPESLATPAFGVGPRLVAGFRPQSNIAIEAGAGFAWLLNLKAGTAATSGGLTTVDIGGTYSF